MATFAAYSLAVRSGRGLKGGDKDVAPSLFNGTTLNGGDGGGDSRWRPAAAERERKDWILDFGFCRIWCWHFPPE